jgi:hypothetical protein
VGWDEVLIGQAAVSGDVLVLDDQADLIGPLMAVHAAQAGASSVRLVTRWPMVASETVADAYFEWIMPQVYESGVHLYVDHFVAALAASSATLYNIYLPGRTFEVPADMVVMATARQSVNSLADTARQAGLPVTVIGDAVAPRGTFEAVYEGHRHGRDV